MSRLSILATIILLSSSRTVWSYEIPIYQMAMASFPFTWICLIPLSATRVLSFFTTSITRWVSYSKHELLTFREHLGSLLMGSVLHTILVFCADPFLCLFVSCVPNVGRGYALSILYCPFGLF